MSNSTDPVAEIGRKFAKVIPLHQEAETRWIHIRSVGVEQNEAKYEAEALFGYMEALESMALSRAPTSLEGIMVQLQRHHAPFADREPCSEFSDYQNALVERRCQFAAEGIVQLLEKMTGSDRKTFGVNYHVSYRRKSLKQVEAAPAGKEVANV
jgi:hypothetical protein